MKDIRVEDEIAAKLAAMAGQNESLEMAVDQALREYLSYREEEDRRWREALAADASVGCGDGIEGEKVIAWLKSWGREAELPPP